MLTKGEEYTDQGQAYYEERYRQRVLAQPHPACSTTGLALGARTNNGLSDAQAVTNGVNEINYLECVS
jgi:hypothetical protein